jgi:DNA ligase-1
VLSYANDHDQVEGTRNGVDFGNAVDLQQTLGNALELSALDVHEDEGRNHMNTPLRASGMIAFGQAAAAVAAHPGKLAKVETLAGYFRTLEDPDLLAAARFFTGKAFAGSDRRTLSLGGRTIVSAAQRVWGFSDADLRAAYRETGDAGAALGPFVRPPHDLGLFSEVLTPASLLDIFERIGDATGKNAARTRQHLCERILRACTDRVEATYVIKIMTGDLRIGLKEGLVLDAIAQAFDADPKAVRRAAMGAGDIGAVAMAASHGALEALQIAYGAPIGFMLASPIPYGDEYRMLDGVQWLIEDKYDGIRVQAHVRGGNVQLFSRTLNEVTHSYPEIEAALAGMPLSAILDGELIAVRNGSVLPFRYLQTRLARKVVDETLLREIPLSFAIFDVLALGDEFLIDLPLAERRARLADMPLAGPHVQIAPFEALVAEAGAAQVNTAFAEARERGNEGIVLKRTDAPYLPGRRGKWWLKLKRELDTLDVVVVAVEWGHGKRAKVLSDYTFAVRDERGALLTIGKAYSGLTDAEIAERTSWFLEHRLPRAAQREKARASEIPVEPRVVLEVAFDVIARSDLHESGFSLRFPRIVRIRDDKPASEIDTLARVEEIYREMLARERVER